jgi:adenylate cyclase
LRHLGSFILVGSPDPLSIFEVMGLEEDSTEGEQDLCGRFQGALEAFTAQRWSEVVGICEGILATFPGDGPSRFYLERCRHYCADKPQLGEGAAIRIDTK